VDGVREVGEVFRAELERLGFEARLSPQGAETARGPHLIAERRGTRGRRLLLIGHLDTVFEKDSPFQRWQREGDKARGPGAVDMKGGDVVVLFALRALQDAGALEGTQIVVILTGDEEDPGPIEASRRELVELARRSDVALGFEASSSGLGEATVARRGASEWHLAVKGTPAHSSGIFSEGVGAGAILESARILKGFYDELSRERDLTFSPGVVLGGTRVVYDDKGVRGTAAGKTNVVAADVEVQGDLRFLGQAQLQGARARMRRIVSEGALPRTSAEITFADAYPAMEPRPGNYALLAMLDQASRALGHGPVVALDPGRRGAGDISFVAAYVDCLDGLGAAGSGAHTAAETVDLATLPPLVQRAAVLIHRLTR
jgi:glutamate carboxypeptidase